MARRKKTRILKLEYQRVLGKKVSTRTWQRIIKHLCISDESLDYADIVRAYATMRRLSPHAKVNRKDAENFVILSENIPNLVCKGSDLLDALQRLNPRPSLPTIYRWGKEIGIGFSVNRVYLPSDLEIWLEKIISLGKYSYERINN